MCCEYPRRSPPARPVLRTSPNHALSSSTSQLRLWVSSFSRRSAPGLLLTPVRPHSHRVYKRSDPRSFIIRETAAEVFKLTGKSELLDTAIALHDAALKDEVCVGA